MSGYVENNIVILGDARRIFELTNDIKCWPKLFTEYEKVEILEKKEREIRFKLTTNEGKSWISRRIVDEIALQSEAERLEPKFPFLRMNIKWVYEELPQNIGVIMTWIQDFEVDPKCGHDTYDMESYLNKSTRKQMKAVKNNVESILNV